MFCEQVAQTVLPNNGEGICPSAWRYLLLLLSGESLVISRHQSLVVWGICLGHDGRLRVEGRIHIVGAIDIWSVSSVCSLSVVYERGGVFICLCIYLYYM